MYQLIDEDNYRQEVSSPQISPISVASPLSDDIDVSWFVDREPDHNIPRLLDDNNIIDYTYYDNYNNYIDIIYNEIAYQIITIPNLHQSDIFTIDVKYKFLEISEEDQNCCICMETREKEDICQFNCNHNLCEICVIDLLNKNKNATCPLCREKIKTIKTQKEEIKDKINKKCGFII